MKYFLFFCSVIFIFLGTVQVGWAVEVESSSVSEDLSNNDQNGFVLPQEGVLDDSNSLNQFDQGTETKTDYYKAEVVEIVEDGQIILFEDPQPYQRLLVEIKDGDRQGEVIELEHGQDVYISEEQKLAVGDSVVIRHTYNMDGSYETIFIQDPYRLSSLFWIVFIFAAFVIGLAGFDGVRSLIGLVISYAILVFFMAENITNGANPLVIAWVGSVLIVMSSTFVSHGFNRRVAIAVASTLIVLLASIFVSEWFVSWTALYGTGSEEAQMLEFTLLQEVDKRGILLAGILIGVLGVLDDVTTAQAAIVAELHRANPQFSFGQLYKRALRVGKEHMIAMTNTLVLAYAGAFFPLFLILTLDNEQPLWVTLNSEFMMEEIIRTLVGSMTLLFAVPVTTLMASYFYGVKNWDFEEEVRKS